MKSWKPFVNFLTIICIITFFTLPVDLHAQEVDETAIRQVLDKQTQSWNSGNIGEFMKSYWQSDSLVFIGKSGPTYGYTSTLENYKKRYPDTAAMGKLQFDVLQIKRLSPAYYYVTAKWNLKRSIGDLQGYFTLLFKKINRHWVIISDHTS